MKHIALVCSLTFSLIISQQIFAADDANHPCKKIEDACTGAGFIKGDYKNKDGLFADCLCPIVLGNPPPKGVTKALPTIDSMTAKACAEKQPKLCHRK